MERKRFEHIDFLRAISIIGVLVVHTFFYSLNNPVNIFVWNYLEFVVVGFVFCSGYVLEAFYAHAFDSLKSVVKWYKKRLIRLLVPFWIYLLIHYLLWILFPNLFQGLGLEKNIEFFIKSFFLIGGIGINWLVLLFLQLTLLFPLLVKILKNQKAFFSYTVLCFLFTLLLTIKQLPTNYKFLMWIPWSGVFLLSMLYARFEKTDQKIFESIVRYIKGALIGAVIFVPLFFITKSLHHPLNQIEHKYPPDLFYLSYSFTATNLVLILSRLKIWEIGFLKRPIHFISSNSYQLFFVEYICLDVVLTLVKKGTLKISAPVEFLTVLVLSCLICAVLSLFSGKINKFRLTPLRWKAKK